MWRLSSAMRNLLHNSVHPPEMEINPLKMVCSCPCGGVRKTTMHTMSHSGMHLSMYNYMYQVTSTVFSRECYNNDNSLISVSK